MRTSGQQAFRRAVLGLSLLAQLLCCSGQGMATTANTRGSLQKAYGRILQYTKDGAAFRSAYVANPQAACQLTRRSLCGAPAGTDDYVKLQVACSPANYDARYDSGRSYNPISAAKDQRPCQTAVAFAVTAAAEAAVASALHINGNSISLSQQDLQFCPGIPRGCYDNWNLESGLERLVNGTVVDYECLPYTAAQSDDPAKLCNYRCNNKPKALAPGKFGYTPIRDVISAQKQIRRYGSFVTRFNLYDDFFPWITKTAVSNPDAVYDCPNTNKPAADGHAVTVVGYNNDQGYWTVKNSWGPDSGNKGFFKVKYGVCGMMLIGDTYGVFFVPDQQQQLAMLAEAPGAANGQKCYFYQGQAGDTLAKIADRAVVNLGQLLFDNINVIRDLNKPLAGVRIRVCNPDPASVRLPGAAAASTKQQASAPGGSAAKAVSGSGARVGAAAPTDAATASDTAPSSEAAAAGSGASTGAGPSEPSWGAAEAKILLDFKSSLGDPAGLNWAQGTQPCGNAAAGVPGWNQVYCSKFGPQQRVYLLDLSSLGLSGSLNATSDLSGLARLQALWLSGNQLSGPLPASWSKFKNIKEIKLDMNALTGTLPDEWANLKRIRRLYLNGNRLSGTLPDYWGAKMNQLQSLFLASNMLQGTVPASWAEMNNLTSASLYDNPGLTGCLPFDWNAKAQRVKLASGPTSTDGAKTLSLSGTCLCGYCKDQLSTACDGTATITPQCAAAAAGANSSAAGAGMVPNTTTTAPLGSGARIGPAPGDGTEPGPEAGDNGSGVAGAAANGSTAGTTAPVASTVPATTAPVGTAVGSTAPLGTTVGSTAPLNATPPAATGTVTGSILPTVPAAGTTAPATGTVAPAAAGTVTPAAGATAAGATAPVATTAPVTAPAAGAAGPAATAPGTTTPAATTAPAGSTGATGTVGTAAPNSTTAPATATTGTVPSTTQSVVPAASAASNGPRFGAVTPSGTIDQPDISVLPDNRKPILMSVDESNGTSIAGGSSSSSNTSR